MSRTLRRGSWPKCRPGVLNMSTQMPLDGPVVAVDGLSALIVTVVLHEDPILIDGHTGVIAEVVVKQVLKVVEAA